jgi:hypothetical protein
MCILQPSSSIDVYAASAVLLPFDTPIQLRLPCPSMCCVLQASGGNWLSSSPAVPSLQQPSPCNYSYLPLLAPAGAAQQQQQPGSPAAAPAVAPGYSVIARASEPHGFGGWFTGNDLLSQHDSQQRQLGLMSPAGHACFEVWIAMELCDGGTLAEQVQRGFQYHPESKQVDMVSSRIRQLRLAQRDHSREGNCFSRQHQYSAVRSNWMTTWCDTT